MILTISEDFIKCLLLHKPEADGTLEESSFQESRTYGVAVAFLLLRTSRCVLEIK